MFNPLGKIVVPTPGTPVQFTSNQKNPTVYLVCHAFMAEVLPTNAGKTYIGIASMNKSTLVGVIAILLPASSTVLPTFSATIAYAPNAIELTQLYVDADNSGEGVLISAIIT
jgi:hypothetical protein